MEEEQVQRIYGCQSGDDWELTVLNRVAKIGLNERVKFQQRLKESQPNDCGGENHGLGKRDWVLEQRSWG